MNFRNLIGIFVITSIGGCASTMSEKEYQSFSNFAAYSEKCFQAEYLSPQLYAEAKNAFTYLMSTWNYDQGKLSAMMGEAYSNFSATAQSCRQVEASAYEITATSRQHRANEKQNQEAFNNMISSPSNKNSNTVNCKKTGEFLNAEIKTFSGMVCPLGWLPVY